MNVCARARTKKPLVHVVIEKSNPKKTILLTQTNRRVHYISVGNQLDIGRVEKYNIHADNGSKKVKPIGN